MADAEAAEAFHQQRETVGLAVAADARNLQHPRGRAHSVPLLVLHAAGIKGGDAVMRANEGNGLGRMPSLSVSQTDLAWVAGSHGHTGTGAGAGDRGHSPIAQVIVVLIAGAWRGFGAAAAGSRGWGIAGTVAGAKGHHTHQPARLAAFPKQTLRKLHATRPESCGVGGGG